MRVEYGETDESESEYEEEEEEAEGENEVENGGADETNSGDEADGVEEEPDSDTDAESGPGTPTTTTTTRNNERISFVYVKATSENINELTLQQIPPILCRWGLKGSGKKAEVAERMKEVLLPAKRLEELKMNLKYAKRLLAEAQGPAKKSKMDTGKAISVDTRISEAELERLVKEVVPYTLSTDKAKQKEFTQKYNLIKRGYHSLINDANSVMESVAEDQGRSNQSWQYVTVRLFDCISDPSAGTRLMEASKEWRSFVLDRLPKPFFMIENVFPPILLSQIDSDEEVMSVEMNFLFDDIEFTRRYSYRDERRPSYVVIGMELFTGPGGAQTLVQGPKALRSKEYGKGYKFTALDNVTITINGYYPSVNRHKFAGLLFGRNTLQIKKNEKFQGKNFLLMLVKAEENEPKWTKLYGVMGKRSEKEVLTQFKKDCSSGDSGVSASSIVVSLRCPLSLGPLINPVRGMKCRHLQCVELSSLTSSVSGNSNRYKCPICQQSYGIDEIFEDGLAKAMLKKYPGADEIIIDATNMTFKPKNHATGHTGDQDNARDSPSDETVNLTETADEPYAFGPVRLEFYPIKKDPYAEEEPRGKGEEPKISNPTNLVVIDEDSQKSPLGLQQSQKAIELE